MMYIQQQQEKMKRKDVKSSSRRQLTAERKRMSMPQQDETVDLSGMALDSLPSPSLNIGTICKLDLSNNNLLSIPESLTARLLNLIVLDVHSNQLKSLPNSIGCLSKLKILNVSGNLLDSLPKTIENCRSLEELNANFNKLTKLPDTIGFELVNLKKLSVNSNKLVFLPSSTSHLTKLHTLDARLNCLRCLPNDLENLTNLQVLNLSQNFHYLDTLPYSLGLLMSLVELDVSYNKITALPDSLGCLRNLEKLSVEGNPMVSPPLEVFEHGLFAVKEYLSQKMNEAHNGASKKRSWIGRLVKCGTFNGRREDTGGFMMSPNYQPVDGLASPISPGMFSPCRLLSPKTYFTR